MPRDAIFDATLALLREGYPFIWNRCRRFDSDIFKTRILGKRVICIHGPDAARVFYDETKLRRLGVAPRRRVVTSLLGRSGVRTLEEGAHRRRKAAFMSLMTPDSIESLMACTAEHWQLAIRRWEKQPSVVLLDEAQVVLTAAACDWAGVPIDVEQATLLARQLGKMVGAFGEAGPRLWRGRLARFSTERWIGAYVEDVRRGNMKAPENSALALLSTLTDEEGHVLDAKSVAAEVINLIRPTAAIAWYVADAVAALHAYPDERVKLVREESGGDATRRFIQEVRRFYPFTPYLGARVRSPFEWAGHSFKVGSFVLLDIYGANRDPRLWAGPEAFDPERFKMHVDDKFAFIPQGGGSYTAGHRCAGERITTLCLAQAVRVLTRQMLYEVVPFQDLSLNLRRMPARPKSGVVIRNVRAIDTPSVGLDHGRRGPACGMQHLAAEESQHGHNDTIE